VHIHLLVLAPTPARSLFLSLFRYRLSLHTRGILKKALARARMSARASIETTALAHSGLERTLEGRTNSFITVASRRAE